MVEGTSKNLENLALYQYANVAGRLASSKETVPFAKGALERLASDFEKILGENKELLDGFKAGALASPEGIAGTINIYNGKYQKALDGLDFNEFYDVRAGILKSILGEKKAEEAKAVFEKYNGQTIGSIRKKMEQAEYILNPEAPEGMFDEEKKKAAKKTKEKLEPIYKLFTLLEQRNYEELKNGATKSTYKELLTEALEKA